MYRLPRCGLWRATAWNEGCFGKSFLLQLCELRSALVIAELTAGIPLKSAAQHAGGVIRA